MSVQNERLFQLLGIKEELAFLAELDTRGRIYAHEDALHHSVHRQFAEALRAR